MTNSSRVPRRVLIADDHQPTRDDIRRALDGDGRFEVAVEVSDAAGAVQSALREKPDLCLLDLRMPGGGLAAIWEITARLPAVKVVVLTVSGEDADLFGALRAGVDGYLLKTTNLNRLLDELDSVCSGEAAIQRTLMARILERFRQRQPRWRHDAGGEPGRRRRRLTSREWEVLELLARGWSTAEIAERLVLTRNAVRVHISSIVRKLGVRDRAAAADFFRRQPDT